MSHIDFSADGQYLQSTLDNKIGWGSSSLNQYSSYSVDPTNIVSLAQQWTANPYTKDLNG